MKSMISKLKSSDIMTEVVYKATFEKLFKSDEWDEVQEEVMMFIAETSEKKSN